MKRLKGSWWMIPTVRKIVLNFFFPIFFLTGGDFSVLLLPPSVSKYYQCLNLNSANCSKLYHAKQWYGTDTSWVCYPSPGFELMLSTQSSVVSCSLHQSISLPLLIRVKYFCSTWSSSLYCIPQVQPSVVSSVSVLECLALEGITYCAMHTQPLCHSYFSTSASVSIFKLEC